MKIRGVALAVAGLIWLTGVAAVQAEDCNEYACTAIENDNERSECVDKKIACYQKKIEESQNQQNTLSGELSYIDNQIAYQEAQIEKTRIEIIKLGKEIDILTNKVENIEEAKQVLVNHLINLTAKAYKAQHLSDLEMFLQSESFSQAVVKKQGENLVNLQISQNLMKLEFEKLDYDQQKIERATRQEEQAAKNEQLKVQQANLEKRKEEKTILLAETKNDEKKYKQLKDEAEKERDSFRRFVAGTGEKTCLGAVPGEGSNGWFYSQRDPRWCNQAIGNSNDSVGEVGCYLTSVSMLFKKHGQGTSPATMAANSANFSVNTAMMRRPPPVPSGFTYRESRYGTSTIDEELKNDRPVIVHVTVNNGYGGHFVVLFAGENGSYKMHDPFYGADLDFTSRYSTGMIDSVRMFTK